VNLPPSEGEAGASHGAMYPATALLLLGTLLKQNGFDVEIIDGWYERNYLERLEIRLREEESRLLYVGFSVMITQTSLALEASKAVKSQAPGVPVVWGGPHATLYPEQTLQAPHVDIVAINEGTWTALELACRIQSGKGFDGLKGIGFKDAANHLVFTEPSDLEKIDSLPHFDFSILDIDRYLQPAGVSVFQREFSQCTEPLRVMPIVSGLGCPFRCQFCINVILGRKYRFRSAASIVAEIERLQELYQANTFLFLDEDFFISKKRALEFLDLVEKKGLHFNSRMWCRVDHFGDHFITDDILRRLSNIGSCSLVMGGESANPEILETLQKGITPEQIRHSLTMIRQHPRIFPRYSFIVGLEGETLRQIRKTFRFCLELKRIHPGVDIAGPFIFRLYPGSPIFKRLVAKYQLSLPDTLEGWAQFTAQTGRAQEMPWTPANFQKHQEEIEFFSGLVMPFHSPIPFGPKTIYRFILERLASFRLRLFWFSLPIERAVFNWVQWLRNRAP